MRCFVYDQWHVVCVSVSVCVCVCVCLQLVTVIEGLAVELSIGGAGEGRHYLLSGALHPELTQVRVYGSHTQPRAKTGAHIGRGAQCVCACVCLCRFLCLWGPEEQAKAHTAAPLHRWYREA